MYDVTPPLRVPVALSFGFVCWRAHAHRVGRNPSETTISINRSVVGFEGFSSVCRLSTRQVSSKVIPIRQQQATHSRQRVGNVLVMKPTVQHTHHSSSSQSFKCYTSFIKKLFAIYIIYIIYKRTVIEREWILKHCYHGNTHNRPTLHD